MLGLAAHDLALQSLVDAEPLRPFVGRCRGCGTNRGWLSVRCGTCGRSPIRELIVALLCGAVAIGFYNTLGLTWELVAYGGFLLLSTALMITDLEAFRIVDRLNLAGTLALAVLLALGAALGGNLDSLLRGLGGAGAYFAGSSLLFLLVRGRGFGAGDVKLSVQLGLFATYVSWGTLGWSVVLTAAVGGVIALVMIVAGGAGLKTELPYGPPMVLGVWGALILVGVGAIPVPT